jgi:hypothetical protein
MQHLNDEELARLVDEDPTEDEIAHLEHCAACVSEVRAMQLQTQALASLPDVEPPPRLAARLHAGMAVEGLLLSNRSRRQSMLRVAASLALFAAGGMAGFLGRGARDEGDMASLQRSPPASVAEATQRLQQAEAAYTAALAAYSEVGGSVPSPDPVSRLAALEGIVLTTRAALNEAPADPVINGYHLTALEQRDAILRQIEAQPAQDENDEQEWY